MLSHFFNNLEKKLVETIIKYINKYDIKREKKEIEKVGKKEGKKDGKKEGKKAGKKNKEGPEKIIDERNISVDTNIQVKAIVRSVKQNYIFYLTMLLSLYAFTKCTHNKSNYLLALFSICFITLYGYVVHMVSHHMNTKISELYKTYDNIFTRNKYLNWLAVKIIDFGEFHAKTHHDSDINKTKQNIALEFINNIVTQGGLLIIMKYFLDLIDNRVILLWALFYATVHNMNYNIVSPLTHRQHHMNDKTNYGIDIWDIIIGSKYDWGTIETHNHTAINIILITAVIVFCSNKFKL
jgi:hypothetical protein